MGGGVLEQYEHTRIVQPYNYANCVAVQYHARCYARCVMHACIFFVNL